MKILDIYSKLSCRSFVSYYKNNKIIAVKETPMDMLVLGEFYYNTFYIIDDNNEIIEARTTIRNMYDICFADTGNYLFFSTFEYRAEKYYLQFCKVSLYDDYKEEMICEIEMKNNLISKGFIYLHCELRAIDDRNLICLYMDDEEESLLVYNKFILIDTAEKSINYLNPIINSNDSFLRDDSSGFRICSDRGERYVIFKTGSIGNWEKLDIYNRNRKNICDEKLICFNTKNFLEEGKQNVQLNGKIIESQKDVGTFEVIIANDSWIIYVLQSFVEKTSSIVRYDTLNDEKTILVSDKYFDYEYYKYFNNNIFGIIKSSGQINIDNLISKKRYTYEYNVYSPYVVFCDDNIAVFEVLFPKQSVIIYDVINMKIIDEYVNRKASYFIEADTLILH